ncbi:MAG: homoserine dehydrogenase, partial [Chitinophagales bacterium]|nr:homoserine dehydrogenase [Chitinophagales bacterium]
YQLQKQYDVPFLYEASVCGAIPIIRNLEEYYDNDLLDAVDAICNGTTNYILTKISEEALPYSEALRQAQILGFAESNPALDVQAFDPKYKLNILILHTFGLFVPHEKILNYGIEHLNECDATYAREKGLKIKLIAQTAKKGNNVIGFVMPKFVSKESLFFGVRNEFNAVQLSAAFSEKQFLLGKGAGSFPTASAVLSDISALSHHYRYEYKKVGQNGKLEFSNEEIIPVYMRYQNRDDVHQIKFESIDEEFQSPKHRYVTGTVKIKHLLDAGLNDRKDIFVCAL